MYVKFWKDPEDPQEMNTDAPLTLLALTLFPDILLLIDLTLPISEKAGNLYTKISNQTLFGKVIRFLATNQLTLTYAPFVSSKRDLSHTISPRTG